MEPKDNLQQEIRTMSLYQSACYIQKEYDLSLSVEEIMQGINRTVENCYFYEVQPKTGVRSFLRKLQDAGVHMCIATATDRYQIEAALKRCEMEDFFEEIFTCSEVGYGKDAPIIFRKAMAFLGTDRSSTVVFEDALYAVRTARSDGFLTVGIFDSHIKEQQTLQDLCDCYIENYKHPASFWKFASQR